MNRRVTSGTIESKRLLLFVGAKVLDDIGFAPMGVVDRSYGCVPRLNMPLHTIFGNGTQQITNF